MSHASQSEKDYFRRIGRQNRALSKAKPPGSLEEMFARMATLKQQLGALVDPGETDETGDLQSHLDYLERLRTLDHTNGP